MKKTAVCATYLEDVHDIGALNRTVNKAASLLRKWGLRKFDALAFRGMSGAALGYTLAYKLSKGLICVRKPDESSHSMYLVEGMINSRYVIVDDFIDSGNTINTIVEDIRRFSCERSKPVGILLYKHNAFAPRKGLLDPLLAKVPILLTDSGKINEASPF